MLLHHGTTRRRAESIVENGPNARFMEPNGSTADGFSTSPAGGPFDFGSPEDYARGKAKNFPDEGGPAILVIEFPAELVDSMVGSVGTLIPGKAFNAGTEIRFEPGGGLEQLLAVWSQLSKTITLL